MLNKLQLVNINAAGNLAVNLFMFFLPVFIFMMKYERQLPVTSLHSYVYDSVIDSLIFSNEIIELRPIFRLFPSNIHP